MKMEGTMNNKGKATVLLLVTLSGIFLCFTLIAFFLLKQETNKRVATESKLTKVTSACIDAERQLSDTKKQLFLLEEKLKEAELKIKSVLNDLEVAKSTQEGIVTENTRFKDALAKAEADKNNLTQQITQAQAELNGLKQKVDGMEKEKANSQKAGQTNEIPLGKIVVNQNNPVEAPPATILTINKEYQFVVTNLGVQDAVAPEQVLTVARDNQALGELKIQRVQGNLSVADAVPPLKVETLKEGDHVAVKK